MPMSDDNLLKSAIADADMVRQTAIANARLAIEEAIAPQITEEVTRALRDDTSLLLGEASNPTLGTDPQDFAQVGEGKEHADLKSSGVGSSGESGSGKSGEDLSDKMGPAEGESDTSGPAATLKSSDIGNDGESDGDPDRGAAKSPSSDTAETTIKEDYVDENIDLGEIDAIIKELQAEVDAMRDEPGEEGYGDEPYGEAPHGDEMGMEPQGGDMDMDMGGEAPYGDEMDGPPAPEPELGMAPQGDEYEDDMEEDFDIDSILREIEAELSEDTQTDELAKMVEENARQAGQLAEFRQVVELLRGKLSEVNLLNGKLLYTNKLFKDKELTTEDKVHIIETFDLATTQREIKLLFATLSEAKFGRAKKKSISGGKIVAEGMASKPTGGTAPKGKVLNETTDVDPVWVARMQDLAGIQILND